MLGPAGATQTRGVCFVWPLTSPDPLRWRVTNAEDLERAQTAAAAQGSRRVNTMLQHTKSDAESARRGRLVERRADGANRETDGGGKERFV